MKRKSFLATALLISGSLFFAACNSEEKRKKKPQRSGPATNQPEVHGTKLIREM